MSNKFLLDIPKTFFLTAYTFICGFSYICGFWYNFKIDLQIVFSLLSPLDIIKSFIIPIISGTGVFAMQLLITFADSYGNARYDDLLKKTPSIKTKETPSSSQAKIKKILGFVFSQFGCLIIITTGLAVLVLYNFFETHDRLYYNVFLIACAGIIALCAFCIFSIDSEFYKVEKYIIVAFAIFILPAICYFIGGFTGKGTLKDEKAMVMVDNTACSSDPNEKYILLSLYGSKGISSSLKDYSICLFEADKTSFKSLMPKNHSPSTSDVTTRQTEKPD
ncbi:hypothetical protein [Cronobacter dublinensis]|uniref:hypothetical protein n=1 Tax=Cronobacter dublinensis TaxID=413497 RepID=UPI00300DC7BB